MWTCLNIILWTLFTLKLLLVQNITQRSLLFHEIQTATMWKRDIHASFIANLLLMTSHSHSPLFNTGKSTPIFTWENESPLQLCTLIALAKYWTIYWNLFLKIVVNAKCFRGVLSWGSVAACPERGWWQHYHCRDMWGKRPILIQLFRSDIRSWSIYKEILV